MRFICSLAKSSPLLPLLEKTWVFLYVTKIVSMTVLLRPLLHLSSSIRLLKEDDESVECHPLSPRRVVPCAKFLLCLFPTITLPALKLYYVLHLPAIFLRKWWKTPPHSTGLVATLSRSSCQMWIHLFQFSQGAVFIFVGLQQRCDQYVVVFFF